MLKKSVDARKKEQIFFIYQVDFFTDNEKRVLSRYKKNDVTIKSEKKENYTAKCEAAAEKVRAAAAQTQPEPAQEISVDPEMPVQPDVEPVSQPKPEPILMTRFYAKGTKAQLIGLKNYLEKEGIEYGNV